MYSAERRFRAKGSKSVANRILTLRTTINKRHMVPRKGHLEGSPKSVGMRFRDGDNGRIREPRGNECCKRSDQEGGATQGNKRLRQGRSQSMPHAPRRNEELATHDITLSKRVKIMRPAAVWSTLVTTTWTILPM